MITVFISVNGDREEETPVSVRMGGASLTTWPRGLEGDQFSPAAPGPQVGAEVDPWKPFPLPDESF